MSEEKVASFSRPALSVIFSNIAKAAGKQQLSEKEGLFNALANKFRTPESEEGEFQDFKDLINKDLSSNYPELQSKAEKVGARGVLRAIRWGQKVSTLQKSLVDRYTAKGEALTENKELYVCEACGFIYLGMKVPEICPVCKAPKSRFSSIK